MGVAAPENKDEVLFFVGDGFYDGICEFFPAFVAVGVGLVGANGEGGIEEKDTLFGPVLEVACGVCEFAYV